MVTDQLEDEWEPFPLVSSLVSLLHMHSVTVSKQKSKSSLSVPHHRKSYRHTDIFHPSIPSKKTFSWPFLSAPKTCSSPAAPPSLPGSWHPCDLQSEQMDTRQLDVRTQREWLTSPARIGFTPRQKHIARPRCWAGQTPWLLLTCGAAQKQL